MLKYSDRITKLTDAQKIRILSNVGKISGKDMKNLGIPSITVGAMKEQDRTVYPHTTSLSHAWNTELWSAVASVKSKKMAADGVHFAIAPGAKIKLSPYRKEPSEDPYFAALLSGSYMKAATDLGMPSGAAGYYMTEADAEWLDRTPDLRILNEYVVRPYVRAKEFSTSSGAILTDIRTPSETYAESCAYLQRVMLDQTEFLICEEANDDTTVPLISNRVVCLHASENALSSALVRYRKLTKLLEEGKNVTLLQIEEEVKKGMAISEETIDQAVDHVLEFLFRCKERPIHPLPSEEQEEALALKATQEATVLLKNKDAVLPLLKQNSVLLIDAFFPSEENGAFVDECRERLEAEGFRVRTEKIQLFADTDLQYRIEHLTPSCRNFDTTVLLFGSGARAEKKMHKTEKLTLPPFQLSLADEVAHYANRTVTVIFSEHSTDIEFTRASDAVLFAPLPIKQSARALCEILSGSCNPSGRLAYTLYAGTETSLKKGAAYIRQFGMKTGPFIGYRYYDTADLRVGYPFGHGLSYTKFVYSNLSVSEDGATVSFSVQNAGAVAGYEVAQVYVGMKNSAIVRPKKELCGFAKVYLRPMEEKKITMKLELPKTFEDGQFVLEKGTYSVYVGASVSDVRLKTDFLAGDAELARREERLSDYLQSQSNILNNNYTLEANYGVMKKGVTNIISGAVALALAISITVINVTLNLNLRTLGIISGILAMGSIILFIVEMVQRSRAHAAERKKIAEVNQKYFEEAEQIPVLSTDKMFEEQFDTVSDGPIHFEQIASSDEEIDYSQYIDEKFRVAEAVEEFKRFAAERGYKMERGVVESLFSSLLVSKLLICNGLSDREFNSFVLLLSEYFGCSVCIDNSRLRKEDSKEEETVFFATDAEGYTQKKNILKALENAVNLADKVHVSAIDEINTENVTEWLSPLMRYLRSAKKKKNEIVIPDESGKKWGYVIDHNFWVLVRLSDDQTVDMLPIEIIKTAAVVNLSYVKCQVAEEHISSHGFTSYQVDYMLTQATAGHDISEEIWKKVDKFEKYVKDHAEYSIGNKLWLDLEKQMAVLLSCGMDLEEAIDAALATKLLPSASVALKGKLSKEDKTVLQTLEFVFGEDHVFFAKAYMDCLIIKEKAPEPEPEPVEPIAVEGEVVEEVTEEATEPVAEEVAEEVTEPVAEEVTEEIAEPVAEEVAEEVTEPVAEEVTEEIAEPVAEEVTEEVTEPVAEEATEEIAEPVAEEVTEEVTEPVAEEPVAASEEEKEDKKKKKKKKKTE